MRIRDILLTSVAVLFCTASIFATSATSLHTWVSAATGSDTNACTFASPCATFQGAATKTAANGMISVEGPGDYGPVSISQSLTIDGSNLGSITAISGGDAVAIEGASAAINVTLRGLTINGAGQGAVGVYLAVPGNLTIENCLIENFSSAGSEGVNIGSTAAQNAVVRNTFIVNNDIGYFVGGGEGPVKSALQNVTIQDAATTAVFVGGGGSMEISNSVLTQSGTAVMVSSIWNATISVESSMLTQNTTAVCSYTTGKIRLENNDIFDNGTGVANCGGTIKTNGNNRDSGNTNGNPVLPADVSSTVLF